MSHHFSIIRIVMLWIAFGVGYFIPGMKFLSDKNPYSQKPTQFYLLASIIFSTLSKKSNVAGMLYMIFTKQRAAQIFDEVQKIQVII